MIYIRFNNFLKIEFTFREIINGGYSFVIDYSPFEYNDAIIPFVYYLYNNAVDI